MPDLIRIELRPNTGPHCINTGAKEIYHLLVTGSDGKEYTIRTYYCLSDAYKTASEYEKQFADGELTIENMIEFYKNFSTVAREALEAVLN